MDGRAVLTATLGSTGAANTEVVLAKGVHQVRLAGTLATQAGRIELRWGTGTGTLVPISPTYLWNGPPGVLIGNSYAAAPADFFTAPALVMPATLPPLITRRDGLLSWRSVNASMHGGGNVAVVWHGTLHLTEAGPYQFEPLTDAPVSVLIDGQLVGARNIPALAQLPQPPFTVNLQPGDHPIEIRFQAAHDGQGFDFFWTPPGQARELLPPSALTNQPGGVWTPAERPGVPGPDPTLIQAGAPDLTGLVVRDIKTTLPWQEARGVAVLPDGSVVVADSGHNRLITYAPDGSWCEPGASRARRPTATSP